MSRQMRLVVFMTFAASCMMSPMVMIAGAETISVCLDGTCDHDEIQMAIDSAFDGDVIEIATGIYHPPYTLNTLGKAVTLRGQPGSEVVIDGQGNHCVLECRNGEGSDTVFENLVIRNGMSIGGGMYNSQSSPMLIGCVFKDNSSWAFAGGMYNWNNSSPTLVGCVFEGNSALSGDGGGMYNYLNSNPTLDGCLFLYNSAHNAGSDSYGDGGGMYNINNSRPTLNDCRFLGNTAASGGGMYCNHRSAAELTSTTVCGNSPDQIVGPWADGGGNCIQEACEDCACFADLTSDVIVDGADLTVLLGAWGETRSPADLNEDGHVDGADLTVLLSAWGPCH